MPVVGGRYRLIEAIGEGGLCVVWRARDTLAGRDVALKWLKPAFVSDARLRRRMYREARAVARLEHSNIVRMYDVVEDQELGPFIAMEWIRGVSFTERLRAGVSLDGLFDATDQILDALAFAHARGVVHRDLKPDNVVVTRGSDGRETIKLLDFGFAWIEDDVDAHISQSDVFGTPVYMAPEQITGEGVLGPWTDLYALAVMLWELICGQPPFTGPKGSAVIVQHVTAPVPEFVPLTDLDVPAGLESVLRKALEKEPAGRFADAAEMRNAIAAARAGSLDAAGPADPDDGPLIGRLDTQRWLWDRVVRACEDGVSQALVLEAAPGLGRTRLCRWLRHALVEGGWMLAGIGPADGAGVREALRDALGLGPEPDGVPEDTIIDAFEMLGLEVLEVPESVSSLLWSRKPIGSRGAAQLDEAVRFLARQRPLLLCLDDLERADPRTLAAVDALVGSLMAEPAPVVLLVTRALLPRDDERFSDFPLVEQFLRRRRGTLDVRRLDPLGPDAMAMMAAHTLGLEPLDANAVLNAAGGNPLLATHAVYFQHEIGRLGRAPGLGDTLEPAEPLPDDPLSLTRARLDRLFHDPPAQLERRLAECFALVGDHVPAGSIDALAESFEVERRRLDDGLAALVRRGVMQVSPEGGHDFVHRLLAAAMRDDVAGRSDASILHGRVADALSRIPRGARGPTTADIAAMYLAGGCLPEAVDFQVRAALEALEAGWPRVADAALIDADKWLAWVTENQARHGADLRLARARWGLATERLELAFREAETAARWSEEAHDRRRATVAYRLVGSAALALRLPEDAARSLRRAEQFAVARDEREGAWRMLAAGRLALERGLLPEARIRFGQASSRFARVNERRGGVEIQIALGELAVRQGQGTVALDQLTAALNRAGELGAIDLRGRALWRLADLHRRAGQDEAALDCYAAAVEAFEQCDRQRSKARALWGLGECRRRLGLPGARKAFLNALTLFEHRHDAVEAAACATRLGSLALEAKDYVGAEQAFTRALAHYEGRDPGPRLGLLHALLARTMHRAGDVEGRNRHLHTALRIDARTPLRSPEWIDILEEVAAGIGQGATARRLIERAREVRALLASRRGAKAQPEALVSGRTSDPPGESAPEE